MDPDKDVRWDPHARGHIPHQHGAATAVAVHPLAYDFVTTIRLDVAMASGHDGRLVSFSLATHPHFTCPIPSARSDEGEGVTGALEGAHNSTTRCVRSPNSI